MAKRHVGGGHVFANRGVQRVRQALAAEFSGTDEAEPAAFTVLGRRPRLKPFGVVTVASSLRLQPSWSPDRLTGNSTSSAELGCPRRAIGLDHVGRRIGKAGQVVVALDAERRR